MTTPAGLTGPTEDRSLVVVAQAAVQIDSDLAFYRRWLAEAVLDPALRAGAVFDSRGNGLAEDLGDQPRPPDWSTLIDGDPATWRQMLAQSPDHATGMVHYDGRSGVLIVAMADRDDDQNIPVAAFWLGPGYGPDAYQRIMLLVGPAKIFHRLHTGRQAVAELRRRDDLDSLTARLLAAESSGEVYCQIVDDWPSVIEPAVADRLIVLPLHRGRPGRCHIGGGGVVDPRSPLVRSAERLAAAVARGQIDVVDSDEVDLAPQMADPIEAHRDIAGAGGMSIHVLRRSDEALAVVIAERFGGQAETTGATVPLERCLPIWTTALGRAIDREEIFLLGPMRRLGKAKSSLRTVRGWIVLSAVVAAVAGGLWWASQPATRVVHADGKVIPAVRRVLHAPRDGVVERLVVGPGEAVAVGDPVVQMRSDELQLRLSDLEGQIDVIEQRLAAARAQRGQTVGDRGSASSQRIDEATLRGLRGQRDLVASMIDQMTLTSPIDGRLISRTESGQMDNRPVRRGESLATIADPDGDWQIVLDLDQQAAGHLLRLPGGGLNQPVRFYTLRDPSRTHAAIVDRIDPVVDPDTDAAVRVRVWAMIRRDDDLADRLAGGQISAGQTVVARIDAGLASNADVHFGDLVRWVRYRTAFWW